jgi:hypothetical protein
MRAYAARLAWVLVGPSCAVGCGLAVQGTTQTVSITSEPPGASVAFAGRHTITPGAVSVRRQEWAVLRVWKAGHRPACRLVGAPRNPWLAILDTVPLLGIGWAIDKPTDALRRFPSELRVSLRPLDADETADPLPPDELVLHEWKHHETDVCERRED